MARDDEYMMKGKLDYSKGTIKGRIYFIFYSVVKQLLKRKDQFKFKR